MCAPDSGEAQGTDDTSDASTDGFGGTPRASLLASIAGTSEQFRNSSAPRSFFVGPRYEFGRKARAAATSKD